MKRMIILGTVALALLGTTTPGGVGTYAANEEQKSEAVKTADADESKTVSKSPEENIVDTKSEGETTSDSSQDDGTEGKVAEQNQEPPTKKYKFYKDIRSIDDLNEGAEEDVDETLENQNMKIVYKTPESCKEFTLYLDNKARKLERMELELKKKEKEIQKMQENFEQLTQKYVTVENRIKEIMQKDPTNLKGNPELTKMVKLYETFSAEEAAARLQNLDLDLTIAILKGIKPKTLSKIMAAMDPKVSAALSSQMVRGF